MGVVDVERLEDGKLDDIDIPVMSSDYHLVASDEKGTRGVAVPIDGAQVLCQTGIFELWFFIFILFIFLILVFFLFFFAVFFAVLFPIFLLSIIISSVIVVSGLVNVYPLGGGLISFGPVTNTSIIIIITAIMLGYCRWFFGLFRVWLLRRVLVF